MSLSLNPNSVNKMDLKVKDMVIISNPFYRWRFIHELSRVDLKIDLTDGFPDNPRFAEFTLTLPTDLNLEGGMHKYTVYESATANNDDFDNMRILSEGRLDVTEAAPTDKTYETDGTDKVYKQ